MICNQLPLLTKLRLNLREDNVAPCYPTLLGQSNSDDNQSTQFNLEAQSARPTAPSPPSLRRRLRLDHRGENVPHRANLSDTRARRI